MQSWITDLRYAVRRLAKSPGFVLATVLMLGLGIALSVAMYSVVRNVLVAGLPFPQGENVVEVSSANASQDVSNGQLTPAEAERLVEPGGPFAKLGYYTWGGLTVYDGERPREFTLIIASDGFFPALGLQPQLGRWFDAEDFEAETGAIVISHDEWQRLLGGDPNAIGRMIETSDGRMRVIGVMPAGFDTPSRDVGAWRPLRAAAHFKRDAPWYWNARMLFAVARLDPAIDATQREQRLAALLAELRERHSMPDDGWRIASIPMLDRIVGDIRGVLWGVFALALLVLLIGCANVAIAIDARQIARRHEQALTQAIGASRARLYRGLLLEIGLLAVLAVALGVTLAAVGVDWLRELARDSVPRVDAIVLQWDALGFAAALGLVLPFLAAFAGSLRLRAQPADAIRGGGKGMVAGTGRQHRLLPALGVALSTVGLVAASALLLSLGDLQRVDPGFRSENVHAMQFFVNGGPTEWRRVSEELHAKLVSLPGVEHVAVSSAAPLSTIGSFAIDLKLPERDRAEPYQIGLRRVSPGYLDLLAIPLLTGRGIEAGDGEGSEAVAVINRTLATRLFGSDSALERSVLLPLGQSDRVPYRIVGVMEDIRNDGLRSAPGPELLISQAQNPWIGMTFLLRTAQPLPGIEAQMAQALWSVSSRQAITREFTLREDLDEQLATVKFFSRTVGVFAFAALALAALGVYAVAALQQQRRIGEFGLRLAVGASPASLVNRILRDCLATISVGIALGLFGAWAALRLIENQLSNSDVQGALALPVGAALIALAAVCAALLPALRATRIDPMTSLRHN